jgi:hypothetical protein
MASGPDRINLPLKMNAATLATLRGSPRRKADTNPRARGWGFFPPCPFLLFLFGIFPLARFFIFAYSSI